VPLLVALLGLGLCAPSLAGGLQTEDWVFRAVALGPDTELPWRVNVFGHAQPPPSGLLRAQVQLAREVGILPWHTADDFHVSFWRPLSSWTHQLDHRLFDGSPAWMHAQSLLWYALCVWAAAHLYRRLLEPAWIAGLAAVLYAVDDAHGHAVGWLSNRNGVMAAAFGTLALVAHDRWRREGWRPGAWLAPPALLFGLLSGELALGTLAYLAAHAVLLDPARPMLRWRAVVPWLSAAAAWAIAWRWQGHGSSGSGVYLDPIRSPLGFLGQTLERGPVLLLGQLAAPPADLWVQLGDARQRLLAAAGVAALLVVGWALAPLVRRDRRLAFWAAGGVLSVVPACAAFPQDRLLFFPGLGAMALAATLLGRIRERLAGRSAPARVAVVALAACFWLLHAAAAVVLLPWRSLTMRRYADGLERAGESAMAAVDPAQNVFLLDAPDYYFGSMIPLTRAAAGQSVPLRMVTLSGTLRGTRLVRLDPHAFELRPVRGILGETFNRIYWPAGARMPVGTRRRLDWTEVRVTDATPDGVPLAVMFRFRWPLESRQLAFLEWRAGRYVRAELPPPGGSRVLRGQ
jgi:hypothetical protein